MVRIFRKATQSLFEGAKKAVGAITKYAKENPKQIIGIEKPKTDKKILELTVPFGGAGNVAKSTGSVIKGTYTALKDFATKKTINPAAGVSGVKNILKVLGKTAGVGALAGGLFQTGRIISKTAISGNTPNAGEVVKSISRGAGTGAGLGLSPLGGALGALEGAGKVGNEVVNKFWGLVTGRGKSYLNETSNKVHDTYKNIKDDLPMAPTPNFEFNVSMPEMPNYSNVMPNVPLIFETPQVQTPSFSPSLSLGGFGGGLSENLPLLLLAGALGGGYLIGRKHGKRKKKRYKKKKRHK